MFQREITPLLESVSKKLDALLKEAGVSSYDISFFRNSDEEGVCVRFYDGLPSGFVPPKVIDGVPVQQR